MLKNRKKDFIYNTIGSVLYALNSVILLMLVVQMVGPEKGGIFSIAFTISQTLGVIGSFEMRVFQVTDKKYKFQDFFLSRVFTSIIMILSAIGWIMLNGYRNDKAIIVFALCCYRLSDSFGDVIEGYYQHENKMYLSGILLSLRTSIPTVLFVISLLISHNLTVSCLLLFISAIITLLLCNFYLIVHRDHVSITGGNVHNAIAIIMSCFPLFLSCFLATYTTNMPKYAIDLFLSEEIQTYYSIVFMPSFAINLLSGFVFKPLLLDIGNVWDKREKNKINQIVLKMTGIIILFTALCILVGYLIGIPVLQLIYGVSKLEKYKNAFIIILLGGGVYAINAFLYHILIVMRKQKTIFLVYTIVFIETIFISNILVRNYSVLGGAITYFISVVSMSTLLLLIMEHEILRK